MQLFCFLVSIFGLVPFAATSPLSGFSSNDRITSAPSYYEYGDDTIVKRSGNRPTSNSFKRISNSQPPLPLSHATAPTRRHPLNPPRSSSGRFLTVHSTGRPVPSPHSQSVPISEQWTRYDQGHPIPDLRDVTQPPNRITDAEVKAYNNRRKTETMAGKLWGSSNSHKSQQRLQEERYKGWNKKGSKGFTPVSTSVHHQLLVRFAHELIKKGGMKPKKGQQYPINGKDFLYKKKVKSKYWKAPPPSRLSRASKATSKDAFKSGSKYTPPLDPADLPFEDLKISGGKMISSSE